MVSITKKNKKRGNLFKHMIEEMLRIHNLKLRARRRLNAVYSLGGF
jgi:hypothetical protein